MVNQKNVFRVIGYINDRGEINLLDPGASIKFPPVSRLTGIWGTARWQAPASTHGQQMCLWIFDFWFQSTKLVSKGSWKYTMYTMNIHSALILGQFLWYNLLGEGCRCFWTCWQTPCPRLLAVFYKTHACIPLLTFVPAETLYANTSITAVFVPSYYNNNAKKTHLNASTTFSFNKEEKEELLCFICLNIPWFQHIHQSLSNLRLGRVYQFHKAHTLPRYNDIILVFSASYRRAQKD